MGKFWHFIGFNALIKADAVYCIAMESSSMEVWSLCAMIMKWARNGVVSTLVKKTETVVGNKDTLCCGYQKLRKP